MYIILFLDLDIKLHLVVLPLLSPLHNSLSIQVQLRVIEVLVEMTNFLKLLQNFF